MTTCPSYWPNSQLVCLPNAPISTWPLLHMSPATAPSHRTNHDLSPAHTRSLHLQQTVNLCDFTVREALRARGGLQEIRVRGFSELMCLLVMEDGQRKEEKAPGGTPRCHLQGCVGLKKLYFLSDMKSLRSRG